MSQIIDTHFLVEPCESVTFGPPRSFSAGEAHRIHSQFPPPPLTFQGLVRTRLLLGADPPLDLDSPATKSEIERLVGPPWELPRDWQLQGPFPARRVPPPPEDPEEIPAVQPWVPAPRFLLRHGRRVLHAREVISSHRGLSDLGDPTLFGRPGRGESKPLGGWIGPSNLRYALAGEGCNHWDAKQWHATRPPFVKNEFQPGLAIDPQASNARHGMLYFAEALRFERGGGLLGHLQAPLHEGLSAWSLTDGAGQAGRKGRIVCFRAVERLDPDWEYIMQGQHLPERVEDGARFWLVAVTPVRLDDPRKPKLRVAIPGSVRMEFLAALTGRAFSVGGYEMTSGRPRENRLYVPAGSAWLIRLDGGTPESRRAALLDLHNHHPLGLAHEAAMGFGHTLVGLGPMTTEEAP